MEKRKVKIYGTDIISEKEGYVNIFGGFDSYHTQVLKSITGYYIGTLTQSDIGSDAFIPNERLSKYYNTFEEAQTALIENRY